MITHTGERPHVCDVANCNKAYGRIEDLRNHQKKVHIEGDIDWTRELSALTSDDFSRDENSITVQHMQVDVDISEGNTNMNEMLNECENNSNKSV